MIEINIPSKLRIGGFEAIIKQEKNLMVDRNNIGEWHPRTQTIVLDESASEQRKEETLIHEILEAIIDIYDVEIEHHKLSVIATVLHQIIKDNSEVFR